MKRCRKCEVELVVGDNWTAGLHRHNNYICKVCHSGSVKKYWSKNPEKRKDNWASWYENNKGYRSEYMSSWGKENQHKKNAITRKYVANKLAQTPEMNKAELVEIESMYMYNQIMPGNWHVDHIDPLVNGGLHHPGNLQVLTQSENCSKGGRV